MSLREKVREARRVAQPLDPEASVTDPPYRAVSIYPSMLLAHAGITANQVTIAWVFAGLVGVVALGWTSYAVRVTGALLLQVSYLFDFVDGEVARLQKCTSKRGFLLDLLGHGLIKASLFLALGYREFLTTQRTAGLLLAFVASASLVNVYALPFLAARAGVRNQPTARSGGAPARRSAVRQLLGMVGLLFESPGLYALVLAAVAARQIGVLLLFYGMLTPLWLLWRIGKYRFE